MKIKIGKYSFLVDPGSNQAAWEYINTGKWEPHTFQILNHFLSPNEAVLDLGAWSGVISLYAAHIAEKVYALDPDPICFHELQSNINLNSSLISKIEAYPIAISNKRERVQLSARKAYGQSSSSILIRARDKETSYAINTLTLEDFIEQEKIKNVGFIKMDIEGAEFKILPSIGSAIKQLKYPTLYISFHYKYLQEHFYQKNIPFAILSKILFKIEDQLGFSIFDRKIRNTIRPLFNGLSSYKHIYTTDGTKTDIPSLKRNYKFLKYNDLIFTNKPWK